MQQTHHIEAPGPGNQYLLPHARILLESYLHLVGEPLLQGIEDGYDQNAAKALYLAPFAVVSHDTREDPVFNYGNQCALTLFEMTWGDFVRLPSRKSAQSPQRRQREQFLSRVLRDGYVKDYCGVRISATGRRFMIENATVWNIRLQGQYFGQAAVIKSWRTISGS